MSETTPKLVSINYNLKEVNYNLAIIKNNEKLIKNSYSIINSLKTKQSVTTLDKQNIYSELYKIHKLKQNISTIINNTKKNYTSFKSKFKIIGGNNTLELDNTKKQKQKQQNMNDYLSYKQFIEEQQKKYKL